MYPKKMLRIVQKGLFLTLFLLLPGLAVTRAQETRFDGVVQQRSGLPGPGVTIAVCTQPAVTTTTPCSPLATLFTSTTGAVTCSGTLLPPGVPGSPCSNPMIADGLGNYHFYAAPGTYTYQFYGPGITPFIMPDQQIASGGVVPATVSIKPKVNDNICYVSGPNGNDSNDGLSIGTAKLTIYSCLTTVLPGGTSTSVGNGTILISGFPSYGGPIPNQGFWLMGGTDPNFGSPPLGWLKTNNSFPTTINIDCFASYLSEASGNTPRCGMLAGSNSPVLIPIWLSGVSGNIVFNNLELNNFLGSYIRLGIDSNGNRNGLGGDSGLAFNNVGFNVGGCGSSPNQKGPGVDIGSNTFWVWFKKLDGSGCPKEIFSIANSGAVRLNGTVTVTTTVTHDISNNEMVTMTDIPDDSFNGSFTATFIDGTHFSYQNSGPNVTSGTGGHVVTARTAAVNMDPGTGPGSGLIWFNDTNINGGNFRWLTGASGGGFYATNTSYEGSGSGSGTPDAPTFLVIGPKATSNAAGTNIRIETVQQSDFNAPIPGVQVDAPSTNFPDLVQVENVAGYVRGKMTVICCTAIASSTNTATYLRQQQYGIRQGQLIATGIDVARRGFSPIAVKGTNLATLPAAWTFGSGTGTVTTGIQAPDLTNNAGRVTWSSGIPSASIQFYNSSAALNIGDSYIFGVWARSVTNNGYAGGVFPIQFVLNNGGGAGDACVGFQGQPSSPAAPVLGNANSSVQGDGQWQWYSGVCKVAANPTVPGLMFAGIVDSTHTLDFYAPTVYLAPSGTVSDNEAYEIAFNMSSWPATAAAGEVSMLPGQFLRLGTSLFANLGTPGNGVFVYCPDCTVANPCAGAGTGALAKRLNGAWVCN